MIHNDLAAWFLERFSNVHYSSLLILQEKNEEVKNIFFYFVKVAFSDLNTIPLKGKKGKNVHLKRLLNDLDH